MRRGWSVALDEQPPAGTHAKPKMKWCSVLIVDCVHSPPCCAGVVLRLEAAGMPPHTLTTTAVQRPAGSSAKIAQHGGLAAMKH